MPHSFAGWIGAVQLFVNIGALVGGAVVWRLYVENLRAQMGVKDDTITNVEKSRDFWKDKAQDLEKRSPEFMERILTERIGTREAEIVRLDKDREENKESIRLLNEEKVRIESTLERARGFAAMLELEGEAAEDDAFLGELEVVKLGDVGVDSGQLMITDPCYVDSEWTNQDERPFEDIRIYDDVETGQVLQFQKDFRHYEETPPGYGNTVNELVATGRLMRREEEVQGPFQYSYAGSCDATLTKGYGELVYQMGHPGAGVAFRTAFGDGDYPIYGEKRDGRLVRVYVNVA